MTSLHKTLQISASPHLKQMRQVDDIMKNVVYALLPVCLFAVYLFGIGALITLTVATLSCVLTEYIMCRHSADSSSIKDYSATITGLLYGLTLPPGLPLWMVVLGGIIAIALGKQLFGGLGFNIFNPALVGRAFLQAAFPTAMTTWGVALHPDRFVQLPASLFTLPFYAPDYQQMADGITSATPLALIKFDQQKTEYTDLVTGMSAGSYGETCGVLILAAGVYLAARNMLNWRIPAAILCTAGAFSFVFHLLDPEIYPGVVFTLFSGGLLLGAVFMATDMVATPMSNLGVVVYGIVIGILIMVIRYWGGLPEGVMYAILLANAMSPHIDNLTQPKVFGTSDSHHKEQSK